MNIQRIQTFTFLRLLFHTSIGYFLCPSLQAGIMLDGVAESSYTNFAAQSQFNAIGKFTTGGSGTLIAPNWVLAAGHLGNVAGFQIRGTGTVYGVSQIIRNPTFLANGSDLNYGHDIALMKLSTSVVGVTPASIYRGSNEIGQLAAITGFGVGGFGNAGTESLAEAQRAGTNVIDTAFNFANGSGGQLGSQDAAFLVDFDAPNGIGSPGQFNTLLGSGSNAAPTSLEYQLARLDSGGGMFIQENGEWKLAGVNSGIASQRQLLGTGSTKQLGYGAVSLFTRVRSYQGFIDGVTAVPEPSSILMLTMAPVLMAARQLRKRKRNQAIDRDECATAD